MYVALPQRSCLQRKFLLRTESVLGMVWEGRKETKRQTLSLLERALWGPGWAHNLIRSSEPWCRAGWAVAWPHCALLLPLHLVLALFSPQLWESTKQLLYIKFPNLGYVGGGERQRWGEAHHPAHKNIKYLKRTHIVVST